MDSTMTINKKKILDWVSQIQDKDLLDQITELMQQSEKKLYDPTYESTLNDKEKEEYWRKVGVSGDELFDDVMAHIKTLPWKK